jgi:hypothetical protein
MRLTHKQTQLDKEELRFSFKPGSMKINSVAFACTCLLLLCSCATEKSIRLRLPADVTMNKEAGQGGMLIVTLQLESGEKLPFMVDTGASGTGFDKSLAPKLGKRLGTGTALHFGDRQEGGAYTAPRLYLEGAPLMMTGTNVFTYDLRPFSSNAGRPILGVLGMDVLGHYCIQLDFQAGKMRFLDDEPAGKKDWGRPFPLTDIGDGRFSVRENLAGAKDSDSMIDSGCNYDGWLSQPLFQQWTNQAKLPVNGEVRFPMGVLGGDTYPNVNLRGFGAEALSVGDSHIVFNGIGLHFLARHLVTFDFPKRTMYLKRTNIGPLVDEDMEAVGQAVAESAIKILMSLKEKGQMPGWSKNDEATTKIVTFHYHYPDSLTLDLLKKGDSSTYHYEFSRVSKTSPWKLQKAWQTDSNEHLVKDYPVPQAFHPR